MKNSITIICKPTHNCNMNCDYCYDKQEKTLIKNEKIPMDILEQAIKISLKSFKNITWIWHGGEATLMGKDFFIKAKEIFDKYMTEEHNIEFMTQSNGKNAAETRQWLEELNIKPGYSYDAFNNNKYRKEEYDIIKNLKDDDGIITVVTEPNIDLIESFKKYQKRGISFNKIFFNNKKNDVDGYVNSFKKLFDYMLWNKNIDNLERNLSGYIQVICNSKDVYCNMKQCLGNMLSINPDGTIMICDTFGIKDKKYHLGNVMDYTEMQDCFSSKGFINAVKDDFEFRKNHCEKCEINMFCKNICKNSRYNLNGERDLSKQNEQECEFRKKLLNYIFETLFNLTRKDLLIINEKIYNILIENKFIFKFIIDELEENKYV